MYLFDTLIRKFSLWLGGSFDFTPLPMYETHPVTRSALPAVIPKQRTKSRTKTQVRPDAETFSELLDSLDGSFETMTIPDMKGHWLENSEVTAIKKLGVFVPTPWLLEMVQVPAIPTDVPLPGICSAVLVRKGFDTKDSIHPRFVFAIKYAKLPYTVEKMVGTPYKFGYCVELTEREDGGKPRIMWFWCWMVVAPDRSICIPKERKATTRVIRNGSKKNWAWITQTNWQDPQIMHPEIGRDKAEHERFMKCVFRQAIVWWTARNSRWSVGVRKDDKRMTFSIAPEHTAAYFADREKTITVNGQTKKIIHFVRQHQRSNGSVVREHVRGERQFTWRDFSCAVTAPQLNGAVVTSHFDIETVEVDAIELPSGLMEIDAAAEKLADAEDYPSA